MLDIVQILRTGNLTNLRRVEWIIRGSGPRPDVVGMNNKDQMTLDKFIEFPGAIQGHKGEALARGREVWDNSVLTL